MAARRQAVLRPGELGGGSEADRPTLRDARLLSGAHRARRASTPKPPDGVALDVAIDEGEPTRVGSVERDRPRRAAGRGSPGRPRAGCALTVGSPFGRATGRRRRAGSSSRLRARGYAKATAEGEALVDVKTHQAAVTIVVHPGARYRFGGDRREDRARRARPRAVRLGAGAAGDPRGVDSTATRRWTRPSAASSAWGFSAACKVITGTPDRATARILPVVVTVREAPFRTLRLGAGLMIDRDPQRGPAHRRLDPPQLPGRDAKAHASRRGRVGVYPQPLRRRQQRPVGARRATGRCSISASTFEQPRFVGPAVAAATERARARADAPTDLRQPGRARLGAGVVWQPRTRRLDLPRLPPGGRLPERLADQQRGDGAAHAGVPDDLGHLHRLALVPRAGA